MFSKNDLVATVRTGIIFLWTWLLGYVLALPAVANVPEVGDFLNDLGGVLTGSFAVLVGIAIYAVLYKLAQMKNIVGTLVSKLFIFPAQPTYTPVA